ncbi:MAG: hypothetical protein H7249_13885 [Chitinophagaceae bacterium]|nr:hypothetical protein [Oligoflexus sp.]
MFRSLLMFLLMASNLGVVSCSSSNKTDTASPTGTASINYDAFYVVNGESNSISVINSKSAAVTATFPLTGVTYPHHINLSPDGTMLMVGAPGMDFSGGHDGSMSTMQGSILMLDAMTGAIMKTRKLDGMAHNAAYSPDGTEVWSALMTMPGKLLILDAQTLATKKTIVVGDMPAEVTFSKDGKYAFVANGMSNNVSVIDVSTKAVVKTIAVGDDPVGAWPASDGLMYVDNEKGKSISAMSASTLTVVRTYDLGFTPGMATLAPSGELWVSDADNGKVSYFMKGSTMKMGDITVGSGAHAIAFTRDGTMALVTNQLAGTASMIDIGSHKVMSTITVGKKPNGSIFRSTSVNSLVE